MEKEGFITSAPSRFITELIDGVFTTLFLEMNLLTIISEPLPLLPSFTGSETKKLEEYEFAFLKDLLFEYPGLCLQILYAPVPNEAKYLQRRRTRTFKKHLKKNHVDLNKFVFTNETIENSSFCQACFQGRAISMDGCK